MRRAVQPTAPASPSAQAYNKRATVLYLLQRYREAIDDCRITLQMNPLHFKAAAGAPAEQGAAPRCRGPCMRRPAASGPLQQRMHNAALLQFPVCILPPQAWACAAPRWATRRARLRPISRPLPSTPACATCATPSPSCASSWWRGGRTARAPPSREQPPPVASVVSLAGAAGRFRRRPTAKRHGPEFSGRPQSPVPCTAVRHFKPIPSTPLREAPCPPQVFPPLPPALYPSRTAVVAPRSLAAGGWLYPALIPAAFHLRPRV